MSSPGWFPGDSVMATRSLDAVALGKYLQNRALTLFLAVLVLSLAVDTDAYAACRRDSDCPGRGAIAGDYCCGQFGCCTLPAYQLIVSAHHRLQGECKQDYHDQYEECFQRIVGCTNNSTGDLGICLKHACFPPDRTNCCYVRNVAMTKCVMRAQVSYTKIPKYQTLCLPVSCMASEQAALVLEDINVLKCAVLNNDLRPGCPMTSAVTRCYDNNDVFCKNPYQCEAVHYGTVTALDCPWSEHNASAPTPFTNTPSTRTSTETSYTTATNSTVLPSVGTTTGASTGITSTAPGNGSSNATTPTATSKATTTSAGNVTTNAAPTTSMDNVTSVAPNATASTSSTSTSNSNSTTSFTSPPTANASSSTQPSQVSSITGSSGHASTAPPSSPAPSNATTTATTTATAHSGVQSTSTRMPTQTPAVTVTSAKSPRSPQTSSPFSSTAPRPTPATGPLGSTVPPSPLTTDHGANPSRSTTDTGSASTQDVSMATPTPASSNTTAPPFHAHGSQMTVMIAVGTSVGVVCTVAVIVAIAAFIKSKKYRRQAEEISSRYVHMEENV